MSTSYCSYQAEQIRLERHRLIKKGFIRPPYAMQPQLMAKDENGNWVPEIKEITQ